MLSYTEVFARFTEFHTCDSPNAINRSLVKAQYYHFSERFGLIGSAEVMGLGDFLDITAECISRLLILFFKFYWCPIS